MEAEVEAESRIHELQLRVDELEKLREADQAELAALRESEQASARELEDTKKDSSRHSEEAKQAREAAVQAKQAKDQVDAEKRQLLDALARSDSDKQQLEANLAELQGAHAATQASLRTIEASYSSASENERSYKLRLQGLEGELAILRKDRDWNHEELARVSEEATKDRREKNAQLSKLQAQLDSAVQSSESATSSLAALRTSHATLDTRLSEAQSTISSLTTQLADSESSFRSEIDTLQRLNQLLERREEDTKKRLDEVEQEWTAAREEIEQTRLSYESEVEKEKARGDALEDRVREIRDFADRLAASGAGAGNSTGLGDLTGISQVDDVFGGANASMVSLPQSPSASTLAIKVQRSGGKSYTELYTSYIKMQEALVFEKAESQRLSECLNEILGEIQDRAPMLREQRNEYERAVAENNDLSVALARALEEKDSSSDLAEARFKQIEEKTREAAIISQQLEDTSRQVRTLTRRVAIHEDPSILDRSGAQDQDMAVTDGASDSDVYISQHLVTFTTIDQLQRQNQKLLKLVRELGKKMEAEEQAVRDRVGRAENSAVEEAHDLIIQLKDEVEMLRAQTGTYQRERDMLRQVLKNRGQGTEDGELSGSSQPTINGSTSSHAALEDLQRNFDAYKRETVVDNQSLRDDLSAARKEASQLHIGVARANAEKEYANERLKTLKDTNKRIEQELVDVSKRNAQLQAGMARQDDATRRVTEEVLDVKSNLDRAQHELMMLKAEKQVWKNVEARLTEDNASLARERTHMSDLMRNLQSMHNELDRTGNEARKRLEEQVTRLSNDLETSRARLTQESENAQQMTMRREIEGRELQAKIDKVTNEYHEAREAYIASKGASERATERLEGAQRQIAAYEEKLAVYEGRWTQSADGASSLSREQQLETQVADLRAEVSAAKMEAEQARSHAGQFKAIAQGHEEALAELNATYDEYKRSMESTVAQKDSELSNLQERVQNLTNDVTSASEEISELHRQMQTQRTKFEQEQQANVDTIASLRYLETQVDSIRASSQSDLEAQTRRANEAHDRYQAEVVAHAEDVKALTTARQQLAEIQSALIEATHKAESAEVKLGSAEGSWSAQRESLQKEINEQKKRCDELAEQNGILHNHLDSVSSQAALIKQVAEDQQPANGEEQAAPTTEAKTMDELHAVIRYVRREKDVAELRLELSRQQETRLRQQLEHTSKQLDARTSELAEERQKASESSASVAQNAALLEKIQSLNMLRESNETLRRETEQYLDRVKTLESRLRETESQLSPLREQVGVLNAEIEARERNIKLLEDDNARWKTRTQQILQKYERIDPAELASLKEELEKVKASLEEAVRERDLAKTRADAIQTDLQDANTRAEAGASRFKSLQKVAREHRDNHQAAQAEFEQAKLSLQQQVEQLTASKTELEQQLQAAQTSSAQSSAADAEASQKSQAEVAELQQHLQKAKEELAAAQEQATSSTSDNDAARKKLEEDMALQMRRNNALLNDNKKFRSQIIELQNKAKETLEEEVQKRVAAMPQASTADGAAASNPAEVQEQLAALETRLNAERDSAVAKAISETETKLRAEWETEKTQLQAQASSASIPNEGEDAEAFQKRVEEVAQGKIAEAVQTREEQLNKEKDAEVAQKLAAKEAELQQANQAKVQEVQKQVSQAAQARATQLAKQHQEAMEKAKKAHAHELAKAVEDAKAAASNQEAGEITGSGASQEDVDKAVKEALEKQDAEHQKQLTQRVTEVQDKAKKEFELKGKVRESQISALKKENLALKAKASAAGAATSPAAPQTPSAPPQAGTSGTSPAATNGSPARGLSIAGRSQTPVAKPATPGALSIAGAAAATATAPADGTTPAGPTVRGRGVRGRGQPRGAAAAGRGRGNIVGSALSAAVEGGAKRAREDEGADGDAKRRKDGEAS